MSLKKNVVANYVGQGWKALTGFIFIPIYIRYLGIESYGLVGIFGMLQAWLVLLDMGMRPALSREMARFSAGVHDVRFVRDLLRSVVTVAAAMAAAIALLAWGASGWLASEWLDANHLSTATVANAIACMGLVVASRFIENLYVSALVGLQRQVLLNAVGVVLSTVRNVGVIAVLAWVSPTVRAFFVWQGLTSLLSIGIFAALVHRQLPGAAGSRFSWAALRHIRRFAGGMLAITFLAQLLTQMDKILLSRLLTLDAFGYYALAATVASALKMVSGPITNALYPRFTELASVEAKRPELRVLYHQSAQLITVLMAPAAVMLMVFAHPILRLWTGDEAIAQAAAPLLRVLALGTLLNGFMWIPFQLQLAYSWTSLGMRVNAVSVAVIVPAIFFLVRGFGAIGAAWAWVSLNVGYVCFTIHFMHRRLFPADKWRWYVHDVGLPLLAAAATGAIARQALPGSLGRVEEGAGLVAAFGFVLAAALCAAPLIRGQLTRRAAAWLAPSRA